jgi:hypothetical protein
MLFSIVILGSAAAIGETKNKSVSNSYIYSCISGNILMVDSRWWVVGNK